MYIRSRTLVWLNNLNMSDVTFFGTPHWFKKSSLSTFATVADCSIAVSDRLKVLGDRLDSSPTFEHHLDDIVKVCNFHLGALRHVRRSLSKDTAEIIAYCIVGSWIDYCNALLFETPERTIAKLQRLHGNLARLVFDVSTRNLHDFGRNLFDLLCDLHWLPINSCLTFKLATFMLQGASSRPTGLRFGPAVSLCTAKSLRSSSLDQLVVSQSVMKITMRRFSSAAPKCGTRCWLPCGQLLVSIHKVSVSIEVSPLPCLI